MGARGADIDHLLIGPGGVYTINTKHHPDAAMWVGGETVLVDGARQQYVPKARFEACQAGRLLTDWVGFPVAVYGVIAVVGVKSLVVRAQPGDGVTVLGRRELTGWLRRREPVLTEAQVEALFEVARRSTTWR